MRPARGLACALIGFAYPMALRPRADDLNMGPPLVDVVRQKNRSCLLLGLTESERIRDTNSMSKAAGLNIEVPSQLMEETIVSLYRVTELIGTSTESWEDAAATAVRTASKRLRDLRVAEVVEQDLHIETDGRITYRIKLRLSFKYEDNL